MKDEHVDELIDLYALGALEPGEQSAVDTHLDACAACRALLVDARRVVDLIGWAPDQRTPPPDLYGKIRRRIEHIERQQQRAVPPPLERARWRLPRLSLAAGLAMVGLVILLALGGWNFRLQRQLAGMSAELQRREGIDRTLQSAGMRAITLEPQPAAPKAWGTMVLNPVGTDAYLIAYNLPVLPKDKTYQLWLVRGTTRFNGGTFRADDRGVATVQVQAREKLGTFTGCGITIEPAGGSPGPTGARVLRGATW